MQFAKALKLTIGTGVAGGVATVFLTVAAVQFPTQTAEATPALAKGKACNTCHTSGKPSKADVKKKRKRSDLWPDDKDIDIAHLLAR